ncbi:anaphase-promoting complex subunit 11 [Cryptococcus deuterogattii 99/473]|uniref:Anaphase-promoting complex subunit 11 n=2 Tax=Cryptococcus deuterogattii TaxID=1859096 RepID=A0A0D0U1Y2_9TREE|nr:anaphase-promoting complex subunit 11 [Cryptococcus deuterogattii R265]KIR25496.1 anaphase-promoting complex subunit 11 [Cryptococcus deuterogattii LA55]KIR31522.1 anaphase-promoting complex subunit 11 [Cryptococcus deuterogattii MMRL2647]KIR42208.1 anaphase-promoting complex subunit 11 [Cryptococcus deuterogattii Ram5]KIR72967.1 anaphase-promoting complex subunit 11 [Cryptococcus deuterogattii CA1014]KIR94854.1 anaphase-promoting complex subunit 11 [Cryptococcus deuterogattii CBS 10090]KI
MKVEVNSYRAVAYWIWDVSDEPHQLYHYAPPDEVGIDDDDDQDVCGICQAAFESTCPDCKIPGDDCPLIWGECTHVFHMHCLLKWIGQKEDESQQQCPMDRRPWVTADRKPDKQPAASPGQKAQHGHPEHDYAGQLDESLTTEMGGTSRAVNAQVESSMEIDEQ